MFKVIKFEIFVARFAVIVQSPMYATGMVTPDAQMATILTNTNSTLQKLIIVRTPKTGSSSTQLYQRKKSTPNVILQLTTLCNI